MSVLVKGMEMPESCCDCFFDYDSIVCMALDKEFPDRSSDDGFYAYCSGRMPDCPLVEVSSEDVQPVKHGRWEEVQWIGGVVYSCSVCGRCAPWKELTTDQVCTEYCPDCGAKMDGEDNV